MTTKTFDSVKLMRELRDQLGREMEHMTPDERLRYIREKAAATVLGMRMSGSGEEAQPDADEERPVAGS
ncbi:MAG: hypothetical protein HY812_08825 [Planctomycetes bacterium]|nr:hypothetical protein [Planctomycetota bacterium]